MKQRPLVGISAGDPAGVGPEITAKALALPEMYRRCRPLVVADAGVMRDAIRFSGLALGVRAVTAPAAGEYGCGTVDVLDLHNVDLGQLVFGRVSGACGKAAFEYVRTVIELALAKEIDATVTGPINKEALQAGGLHYAGHTEIYGGLTKTKDYAMMLADGDFRVVHVSTHVSLREACDRVKKPRVRRVIQLADDALKRLGFAAPRIAVCGLNPHCGENRMFGDEDADEIAPAVAEARAMGIGAEGPIPADTVFSKMKGGQFDIVVAMYHDQGHIPTKLTGFNYDEKTKRWVGMSGVNVTLGLPIIRASVDHGTAFGKAGKGTANPESMIQAIEMAVKLA